MKSIIAICLVLGLVGSTLAATVTPTSNSPGTFNKGPFVVLSADSTGNATDYASWGTTNTVVGTSTPAVFLAGNTKFGPGADNATIWLYGADYASTANKYYIISRKINSTQIANGSTNTAAEESVLASNGGLVATVTWTGTAGGSRAVGVAPGALILAQGEISTATGAVATLSFYVVSGASFTTKALATSSTTVASATGTTGYSYAYAPLSVWYEDSAYYCLYESQVTTTPPGGTAANSAAVMIQGYNSSALIYTTPVTVLSATTTLPTTMGTAILTAGAAGGSNYTNSTYWLVTFRDTTALKTYFYTVTQDGKTVTAIATLTDSGSGTTAVAYSTGGIVPSQANSTYGFLVGYSTGTTSPTYNLSILLNGTSTPVTTYFSLGTPSAVPTGAGLGYSTGYAVLARVVTSATATSYYLNAFFANGTANTTAMASQQSVGSFQDTGNGGVPVSVFADVNGSVWIGYGTGDTANAYTILTASVARLVETTRAYYPAAAGNVLVTIAALLSFVIASLFMF